MSLLFDNFASALVASTVLPADTVITVAATSGDMFPTPAGGDYSVLVLENVHGLKEVVHLTARTNDDLTVIRGREGTVANQYAIDSRIEMRVTTGFLQSSVTEVSSNALNTVC